MRKRRIMMQMMLQMMMTMMILVQKVSSSQTCHNSGCYTARFFFFAPFHLKLVSQSFPFSHSVSQSFYFYLLYIFSSSVFSPFLQFFYPKFLLLCSNCTWCIVAADIYILGSGCISYIVMYNMIKKKKYFVICSGVGGAEMELYFTLHCIVWYRKKCICILILGMGGAELDVYLILYFMIWLM